MTHRGIMKMVDCYEDRDYVHIITERCTGGELFDRIAENTSPSGCFSEVNASRIIKSLLEAVGYLHENDIVHRDIKPENVLFRSSHGDSIKLIDFGLARMHKPGDRPMSNPVGTAYYMSPELLKGEYDKSCDIWSIGIIAYILLCGYPPFNGDTDDEIFESIESGQLEYPNKQAWLDKSDTAKDFIKCLLTRDASRRPTAEEASMHPWIVKAAHPKRTTAKDVDFSTRIQNLRCSVHRLNIWSAAA
jgi:serine/threonine protein kinase